MRVLLLLGLLACGREAEAPPICEPEPVIVSATPSTICVGERSQLRAYALPCGQPATEATERATFTADPSVAIERAEARGVSPGTAKVTATIAGLGAATTLILVAACPPDAAIPDAADAMSD